MDSFSGLLNNAALLLALGVIYDSLGLDAIRRKNRRDLLSGLLVGLLGVAVMLTPWSLKPGIFFDTRWVLLSLCALFFGWVPTLIAVVMTVSFRLFQGGTGAIVGSLVILVTSGVGLYWRRLEHQRGWKLTWWNLYLFGLLVQLAMLSCMLLMPADVRFEILAVVAPPILLIYPLGTMLLGLVLRRQRDRRSAEEERMQLQIQLAQAQKMDLVGQLAGGIAHDFNNILTVILGQAEMAHLRLDNKPRLEKAIVEIQKAARRSSDLTQQLLAFARKQAIDPQVMDLNHNVAGMFKMLRRLIGEDIELQLNAGERLWKVKMDPGQLDQVLTNLCINARDAIAGHGKLIIETDNVVLDENCCRLRPNLIPGEYAVVSVSDNGCGMDAETRRQIFEPFFTTKNVGEGTGLGLATVYGIVKQNKGLVDVYSEPGQGTTFKFYLPRTEGGSLRVGQSSMDRLATGDETVLLVEDDESVLNLTKEMLEGLGYRVFAAGGFKQALEVSAGFSGSIDLLLTDVIMPDCNGLELSTQLLSQHPGMKVLYMSGYTADIIAQHGVLNEGVKFIEKPFSLQNLSLKIRETV